MKTLKIINQRTNQSIGDKISNANNPYYRFIGLMNKKELADDEGLILTPCSSIHMMFMKFPIDVIFIDRKNRIVHLIEGLKPWRFSPIIFKAKSVIELPVGTIARTESQIDDILEIN